MHCNCHEHNIIVSYNCVLQCSSGIEASQSGTMEQSATVQGRGLYGLGWGALVAGLYCLPTLLDDEHSGDGDDGDHGDHGGDGDDYGDPAGDGEQGGDKSCKDDVSTELKNEIDDL